MRKKFLVQIILATAVAAFGLTGCKNKTGTGPGSNKTGTEAGVPPLINNGSDITSGNGVRPEGLSGG